MSVRFLHGYWTIFSGDVPVLACVSMASAIEKAASIGPAKFCGHDAEGLAIYRNVVL